MLGYLLHEKIKKNLLITRDRWKMRIYNSIVLAIWRIISNFIGQSKLVYMRDRNYIGKGGSLINEDLFEDESKKRKPIEVESAKVDFTLSQQDIEYNEQIEQTYDIYGTFRKKKDKLDTWDHKYGKTDDKFRIVDLRDIQKSKKQKDQRKVITGQAVTSYDKGELIEISKTLNIPVKPGFDKEQLGINIKQFLIENNRVLK